MQGESEGRPGFGALPFAIGAVLCWSTVATAFKLTLRVLDPFQMLLVASWASLAVLGLALLIRREPRFGAPASARELGLAALSGLLNPLLYYLVLFTAYDLLPAQQAQPLNYTWALALAVLSAPLLGRPVPRRAFAGLAVGLVGVGVVATRLQPSAVAKTDLAGILLAAGSGVVWASFWVVNLRRSGSPLAKIFWSFVFGAPAVTVAWAALSSTEAMTLTGIAGGSYIGVFEMGIAFVLWLTAMDRAPNPGLIGNVAYLAPFLSLLPIHFVLGEHIHWTAAAGLALIVAGIVVCGRSSDT
ncbi:MAG: DMT family transporter [Armatimonadota bacterium]